jgi:hypothetical protein
LGFAAGRSGWSATQPSGAPNLTGSLDFTRAFDLFTGAGSYLGGVQAGYNYMLSSHILAGVEADISFPNTIAAGQDFMSPFIGVANYRDTVEMFGTVRGRLGYDVNHWLYYATGGLAWTYDQFTRPSSPTARPAQRRPEPSRPPFWAGSDGPREPVSRRRSRPAGRENSSISSPSSATARLRFPKVDRPSGPISPYMKFVPA